uniref:RNA polymerase II-associated factor 1 homolog n=1 Tax=Panagrolaimus sp. PS1159 TaxID=55785 RepID=A0AC35F6W2_9BILA
MSQNARIPLLKKNQTQRPEQRLDIYTKIRHKNTLPEIPMEPRFLQLPFMKLSRFAEYKTTQLEKNYRFELVAERDLDINVDLVDAKRYIAESAEDNGIPEDMDPIDQYLIEEDVKATDKRRANHNEVVNNHSTTHPTKKDVHAVEEFPLLPDFDFWQLPFSQVLFDSDPIPLRNKNKEQIMERAIIQGLTDDKGVSFVAYYAPTDETLQKLQKVEKTGEPLEEDERLEYKLGREYIWSIRNEATRNFEPNYFFCFRDGKAYYNCMDTNVKLTRRLKSAEFERRLLQLSEREFINDEDETNPPAGVDEEQARQEEEEEIRKAKKAKTNEIFGEGSDSSDSSSDDSDSNEASEDEKKAKSKSSSDGSSSSASSDEE